jgi:hypothetical protein
MIDKTLTFPLFDLRTEKYRKAFDDWALGKMPNPFIVVLSIEDDFVEHKTIIIVREMQPELTA